MKTNEQLQKDVQDAIKNEPHMNAAEIGVIAKDGVISLSGIVDCYEKIIETENATKNVEGVIEIIENIIVQIKKPKIEITKKKPSHKKSSSTNKNSFGEGKNIIVTGSIDNWNEKITE